MSFQNLTHLLIEFGADLNTAYKVCCCLVLSDHFSLFPLPVHSTYAVSVLVGCFLFLQWDQLFFTSTSLHLLVFQRIHHLASQKYHGHSAINVFFCLGWPADSCRMHGALPTCPTWVFNCYLLSSTVWVSSTSSVYWCYLLENARGHFLLHFIGPKI